MTSPGVVAIDRVRAADDGPIERYRIERGEILLEVVTLGCAITRLEVANRRGRRENIVLGYQNVDDCLVRADYFGATVGRLANRVANGRLVVEGQEYQLTRNHGRHHLHGGSKGFAQERWQLIDVDDGRVARLRFELPSANGAEGYPGNLRSTTTFSLTDDGELRIEFDAMTDAPGVVNMTNHTYFNLGGAGNGDILQHDLFIAADQFCVVDDELIPTGELREVAGTAFDFRFPTAIGLRIADADPQLLHAGGYDHCMVLRPRVPGEVMRHACTLSDHVSGRRMQVLTDQPGLQLYSGNFLDGTSRGADGVAYQKHAGVCLETAGFPDAPNHSHFPSVQLMPGAPYHAVTAWRFDVLP